MSVRIDLLGTVVEVRTQDPGVERLLALLWEALPAPGDDAPVRTYDVTRDGDGWIATAGESIEAVHESLWNILDGLRYRMLELFEEKLDGFTTLHAAAVARDRRLVLLAGESGAGKTTLTLALLEEGWTYLSDDVSPISHATGLVHPFPKPLGVKDPGAWDAFASSFAAAPDVQRPAGAFLVPPGRWDVATEPLPPAVVVFPAFSRGADAHVEELSTAKAAALASPYVRRLDAAAVSLLKRLCASASCYRMTYGSSGDALREIDCVLDRDKPVQSV